MSIQFSKATADRMAASICSLPDPSTSGRASAHVLGAASSSAPVCTDRMSWLSASSPVVAVMPSQAPPPAPPSPPPSLHHPSGAATGASVMQGVHVPLARASTHTDTLPPAKRMRAAEWLYTDQSSRPSQ